jgi:hypothetical protein
MGACRAMAAGTGRLARAILGQISAGISAPTGRPRRRYSS